MQNVIGYKGSPTDRWASWRAMVDYKGSHMMLKNNPGEWEQRIAERDLGRFQVHLEHYVTPQ